VLLLKNKAAIPQKLKEKILGDDENQYLLLEQLHKAKLFAAVKTLGINQQQFAKSKLISNASFEKEKDTIAFLFMRDFITDEGKNAMMYFYKVDKNDEYSGKTEILHYIAFIKPKDPKQIVVNVYSRSQNYGTPIDKTKGLQEQYDEIINLAIYKDRKRVTPSRRGGGDYYEY
jgi:hypothetical protein